ncbi:MULTISPECIES: PaaX family transcriptional regulator [Streptomyces]|uniref:PaaX family transcriptional regulator n=1 Tax=Streptomyces TaxID=1883 RepID=UPI0029A39084|nr:MULTISPECIES: PaaX family transcriptional regulator C-terminal domain-containing protein [Streptomyces]MDX3086624.1 PaaX family transcriptional regulator C-terminal domain-containing protein [Streptomyces sp. ME12-02E]MDX3330008.1 PaaX family transcriptional regulator C-terminal domain-containing protein [Streptomyces sp. ME02-6978a]MDX3359175.1 PaaX family transcriptional regulator C-terminal domain-containing protein [Streptomyces sp. ME02-6978.2a]WTI29449.1 PaaX family transcriptional reg
MIIVPEQPAAPPPPSPHTPRSLIVTFYGAYGRHVPGPVPVAELIRLLGALGVDAPSVRSSVSRLKRRGLLLPARTTTGAAGYALSPEARQLLRDMDRRVHAAGSPADEGWVLAVFSVPESERQKRHLLRSRLAGLGFGTASPGVWIAPARLHEEARRTLRRLGLETYVDLFRGEHLGFVPTATAVTRWWDLPAIAREHEAFLARHAPALRAWQARPDTPAEEAYRDYLRALDSWRLLPYADPGLPAALLPPDWPGGRAAEVFHALRTRLRDAGATFAGVPPVGGTPAARDGGDGEEPAGGEG